MPPSKQIGDFELVREIGRGGMGVVYEARQVSLNRKVALKVLGPGLGLTGRAIDRFRHEAEAAARLHHTHIVPVYATGAHDGVHYYAMELIEGPSLDRVLKHLRGPGDAVPGALAQTTDHESNIGVTHEAGLSGSSLSSGGAYFDTVARMVAGVADALDYAHQQGVIHRDIKPGNLLVSPDGRLSLNDFGLARILEQPGMTMTGEFVGTPLYMAPEQIAAGRVPVDHRADVYSLGATLYEMLTLQPPFRGERRDQVIAQVLHKEPPPPRRINAKVPVDLETICLKAMDKDPDRRYQTAGQMAEDLRRYVNRFAISARRSGPITRMKKWVRRHPLAAALAGGLLTAMLASAFFAYQAKHDRDQLRTQERQAAVDNAILESLSGDFEAALKAIADAEKRGAEPGLLSMLRGMIEIHRGQPKQALDYLYKADRELPGSVAVRALLVKALAEDGQFQSADAMTMGLEKSRPQTPEDHLFLGLLQSGFDPATALRTLDGMPARARQLPVARLARAKVQTSLAQSTGRAEDGERAREELRHVDLPENHPLLLSARMTANLTMAQAYHQDEPRREAILKESARDLEQFAVPGNNLLALSRLSYYQVLGDDDRFLEALAEAKQDGVELPILVDLEALVYYRRGDFDKALSIMRAGRAEGYEPYRKYHEGVVLATMPGRTAEAEEALMNAIQTCQGGIAPALLPAYLQLLGPEYAQKSQQRALETQQQSEARISSIRNGWYHEVLKYNAGILGEGQLLKRAGENHWNLCEAHFFIGLRHLVEGKRGEAKASFQRSVDTGIYFYYEYNWSRAFLTQIDNPNWLPWCRVN